MHTSHVKFPLVLGFWRVLGQIQLLFLDENRSANCPAIAVRRCTPCFAQSPMVSAGMWWSDHWSRSDGFGVPWRSRMGSLGSGSMVRGFKRGKIDTGSHRFSHEKSGIVNFPFKISAEGRNLSLWDNCKVALPDDTLGCLSARVAWKVRACGE